MQDKTILVIGGGITGVSAAEWLRRDGWHVKLVDHTVPGGPDQASFGNAGLLARTSVVPVSMPGLLRKAPAMLLDPNAPLFLRWRYLPRLLPWLIPFLRNGNIETVHQIADALSILTHDTTEQHRALASGTAAEKFIRTGDLVNLYPSRNDFEADHIGNGIRKRFNLEPSLLNRDQLLQRDPHLGPTYTFGAVFSQYSWITSPGAYVAALFDHFRANGGQFEQAKVVDTRAGKRPEVTLADGKVLQAKKVALCAGAWSGNLSSKLGVTVKLEAERGYHLTMYKANIAAPNPYMITDSKFVVTPMDDMLRAAGIVEFAGLDAPASKAPTDLMRQQMKRVYPKLEFERETLWMGRRPTTPDSLPLIGEAKGAPNVLHAYGGQHVGLTIGPKIARMITDLADQRQPNIDLAPFRVDRFR